jgi:Domain of unknown function (DUF4279)
MNRAVATLRIIGSNLDPDEISALLGAVPSRSERQGQELPSAEGKPPRVARFGQWRIDAPETEPENLDLQVRHMLEALSQDLKIWRSLAKRYKVDVFCGWFMKETNEGVDIKPETLAALGQRGIALALDIYAPDTDA